MSKPKNGQEVAKLFKDTFSNDIGEKCLDYLKATFVDRPVYRTGQSYEETAFREGQRDIITQILREVNKDGNR